MAFVKNEWIGKQVIIEFDMGCKNGYLEKGTLMKVESLDEDGEKYTLSDQYGNSVKTPRSHWHRMYHEPVILFRLATEEDFSGFIKPEKRIVAKMAIRNLIGDSMELAKTDSLDYATIYRVDYISEDLKTVGLWDRKRKSVYTFSSVNLDFFLEGNTYHGPLGMFPGGGELTPYDLEEKSR